MNSDPVWSFQNSRTSSWQTSMLLQLVSIRNIGNHRVLHHNTAQQAQYQGLAKRIARIMTIRAEDLGCGGKCRARTVLTVR